MEFEFIEKLRAGIQQDERVLLGIGDDAAILKTENQNTVITVDLLTEGVDFLIDGTPLPLIGRKAIAVNLSDLAAMGAQPVAVLVAVALPKKNAASMAEQLFKGINTMLSKYQVALIGGDTNTWNGGLVVSVTAIGTVTPYGSLTRSGAKAGDRILVTGQFGGSLLQHQFHFEPRIREALLLNKQYKINAAIDVSDGLSLDLSRVCHESRVGAIIDEHHIPVSNDAVFMAQHEYQAHASNAKTSLEHALTDGEDFELILAVSPDEAVRLIAQQPLDVFLTDIGEFVATPGLWLRNSTGQLKNLAPDGFQH